MKKTIFPALLLACFATASSTSAFAEPLDINTATQAELTALPGLGELKANAVIEYRAAYGPFDTLEDLMAVDGIGLATIANIRPLVVTEPSPSPPAESLKGLLVNINQADATQLMALPGVGEIQANAIVSDRKRNGRFESCQELVRITGIGVATVALLERTCTTTSK